MQPPASASIEPSPQEEIATLVRALMRGDFQSAHSLLTPATADLLPPSRLAAHYEDLCKGTVADRVLLVATAATQDNPCFPNAEPSDLSCVYVSVSGRHPSGQRWDAAIEIVVMCDGRQLLIREVGWGWRR